MFLRSALARLIELSSQCVHCRLLHVLLSLFSCRAGRTPNGFLQSERALVIVMLAFLRAAGNRKRWFDIRFCVRVCIGGPGSFA